LESTHAEQEEMATFYKAPKEMIINELLLVDIPQLCEL
jgi:hypothetical protein